MDLRAHYKYGMSLMQMMTLLAVLGLVITGLYEFYFKAL